MIGVYGPLGFRISKFIIYPLLKISQDYPLGLALYIKNRETKETIDKYIFVSMDEENENAKRDCTFAIKTDNSFIYLYEKDKQPDLIKETLNKIVSWEDGKLRSRYSMIPKEAKDIILNFHKSDKSIYLDLLRVLYPNDKLVFSFLAKRLTDTNPQDYKEIYNIIEQIGEYGPVIDINKETTFISDDFFNYIKNISNNPTNKKQMEYVTI